MVLILLALSHDFLDSLLKIMLKLSLRFNFPFKLGSSNFVGLLDSVNHFLELIYYSFIPHNFLFITINDHYAWATGWLVAIIIEG